ncbi:uncharacterized protein PHACADRAFT_260429 [Phanerochaete carnosa HHB-10118-sp]|uniref:Uncharacterized protein n=1 Tax=Phanerochaete carnosa (strain HHB-10118-sp) TaxID=650164 RepID=K5W000_PHACS|nr:uncharacterized protein PHACADRAFT_260429 [Phanerochaete carnosa HHB-10118-sp]EKM52209.1 hypothetical protein PHACADRAFT_260429 [Phanerochaete carnosa HHB-10118-sp]
MYRTKRRPAVTSCVWLTRSANCIDRFNARKSYLVPGEDAPLPLYDSLLRMDFVMAALTVWEAAKGRQQNHF